MSGQQARGVTRPASGAFPDDSLNSRSRRALLRRSLGLAAALGTVWVAGGALTPASAQFTPIVPRRGQPDLPKVATWETEVRQVDPNVYAYIQGGGPGRSNVSISNAMFVVGPDSVLLVDTLTAPLQAKALVAAVRKITDKPFRHVIITHSHPDHFFGNQFIPDNPEIIAHPRCREEMFQFVAGPAMWERREGWANGDEPRRILPAMTTLDGKATYYLGDNVVEVFPMTPSHTWGDLVVHLPQHKIMALGDIAFFNVVPFLIGADPTGWLAVCERIRAMDVTIIVPGHGPLGGQSELADMADYIRLLRVETRKRFDREMTPGEAAADIDLGRYENWVGTEQIVMNVLRFYQEFSGPLSPVPDLAALRQAAEEYNRILTARGRD